jgi:hypothetical protein
MLQSALLLLVELSCTACSGCPDTSAASTPGPSTTQQHVVTRLNTTVLFAGLPSGLTVASCRYLACGRLLLSARDFCSSTFQGAVETAFIAIL